MHIDMPGFEDMRGTRSAAAAAAMVDRQAAELQKMVDRLSRGRIGDAFRQVRSMYAQGAGLPHPPIVDGEYPMPQGVVHELKAYAQDSVVLTLWQQHRTVYNVDKDLWEELGYTEPDDVIPAWLFSHLPHPNPYVSFPAMIFPLATTGSTPDSLLVQVVVGAFVTGFKLDPDHFPVVTRSTGEIQNSDARIMCSTHDPDAVGLQLLFVGETFHFTDNGDGTISPVRHMATDGIPDCVYTRTSLHIEEPSQTFEKVVELALSRYHKPGYSTADQDDVVVMLSRATAALLYLCAKNADLFSSPAPPARDKKAKGGKPKKQTKVVQVGHRIGAELRAYARSQSESRGTGTGKSRAPHVRRAHFHTYRVGPGRQEEIVKWLAPIPINFNNDGPDVSTIHKII